MISKAAETKNCMRAMTQPGLLDLLKQMNKQLDEIQKALEDYLETKRKAFPRFYFLSNADLLDILGQSKNPAAVQPHLKKCFDNIKSLKLEMPKDTKRPPEASGMSLSI